MDYQPIINKLVKKAQSDFYIFNADIDRRNVDHLLHEIEQRSEKKFDKCSLILTTSGGNPDAGYRLTRYIKNNFKKFVLYVFGFCKSTGTLIALGADEIIMSTFGELGPLDVQVQKDDELLPQLSSLTYWESLLYLSQQNQQIFFDTFYGLIKGTGGRLTTKTLAEISTSLTNHLLAPIAGQISPLKLGEHNRALKISLAYGKRLCNDDDIIEKLALEYPSHSFVIDFCEAKNIFKQVREPNSEERQVEKALFDYVRMVQPADKPIIQYLSPEKKEEQDEGPPSTRVDRTNDQKKDDGNRPDSETSERDAETTAADGSNNQGRKKRKSKV